MKLKPLAFGLACGLVHGAAAFGVMVFSLFTNVLDQTVQAWCDMLPACTYDFVGAVWMGLMALVVGFVGGLVFVWVYNLFVGDKG